MITFLLIALSGVAAIASLFLSKPEKLRLAYLSAAIIAATTLWQAFDAYSESKRQEILEQNAIRELERSTNRFVDVVSEAIYFSSDGWLPSNADDFFSARAAVLFSEYLDLDTEAPVYPQRAWRRYLIEQGHAYRAALQTTIDRDANVLDPSLLAEVVEVHRMSLVNGGLDFIAFSQHERRRPIWIGGAAAPSIEVQTDLLALKRLTVRLQKVGSFPSDQWKMLSLASYNRLPKSLIGKSRFDSEAWIKTNLSR